MSETSPPQTNPYIVDRPVSGDNLFGHREVFQFVQTTLASPRNRIVVLHGQPRVGKSSLLQEIHLHRLPPEQYSTVYIDVSGQEDTPFGTVIYEIASRIAKALNMENPDRKSFAANQSYFEQTFLPDVLAILQSRRLVIIIDEMQTLVSSSESKAEAHGAGVRFLEIIQNVLNNQALNQVLFILAIEHSLSNLPLALSLIIRNAQFHRVRLLSPNDTATVITELSKGQLKFEQAALNKIWHYTSGHPYLTQLLCYQIFDRASQAQQRLIEVHDIDQVIDGLVERAATTFAWIWDDLNVAERLVVSAIGSAQKPGLAHRDEIQQILNEQRIRLSNADLVAATNHLTEEHILELEGQNNFRFNVKLLGQWVRNSHSIQHERANISEMSQGAVDYFTEAQNSHKNKKLVEAIEVYRLALKDNPNHLKAQLGLAQALTDSDRLEEAVQEFENAYWLDENAGRQGLIASQMALAKSQEKQERQIEAAGHYRRVYEVAPSYPPLQERLKNLYDKGEQARLGEDWPAAIDYFEEVVDIAPAYKDAHEKLLIVAQEANKGSGGLNAGRFFKRQDESRRRQTGVITAAGSESANPSAALFSARFSGPLIGVIVVILVVLGGMAGWYIWGTGPALPDSQPTEGAPSGVPVLDDTPTPTPTSEPTAEPTQTPSSEGTAAPVAEPTQESTPEPTVTPTAEATDTPPKAVSPVVPGTPTPETTEAASNSVPTETPLPTPEPVPLPAGEALDIEINRTNPKELFVLLKNGSIYRTRDGGTVWQEIRVANGLGLSMLAIAPSNPEVIYVGAFAQILKSIDGGNNWQGYALPGQVQVQTHDLAIAENNANIIYAATEGGILISQDGGQSWDNGRSEGAGLITPFFTVAIGVNSDGPVYAAGAGDIIYRADDPEAGWRRLVCNGCAGSVYALAVTGDTVYAGGTLASMSRSDNQGLDWLSTNSGIPNPAVPSLDIATILLAPNNTMYAGTGYRATNSNGRGLLKSTDGGINWSYLPLPDTTASIYHVQSAVVDPNNSDMIFIAGFAGVHRSEDGGQSWIKQ